MNFIKRLFQRPSAAVLAQAELCEAHRELLVAQTHLDRSRALVVYHEQRIARLETYLGLKAPEVA